jgi:hypothetical protein
MAGLLVLGAVFAVAIVACDLLRAGSKLQAALGRIAIVHASGLAVSLIFLVATDLMRVVPILIFWCGASLAWFGVRSHIESSILLRVAYMLRGGPMTRGEVIARYDVHYGQTQRLANLVGGGLLRSRPDEASWILTTNGLRVVRLVSRLR